MKKSARVSRKTGKPGFTWLTGSYAPGGEIIVLVFARSVNRYGEFEF